MKCNKVSELINKLTSYKIGDHGTKNKLIPGYKPDDKKTIPKYKNPGNIHAVDTETINNTCRLFIYSETGTDGKCEIEKKETDDEKDIKAVPTLTFLDFYNIFLNKLDKRNLYFFYNLNYDVNAIIRLLFNLIPETETIRQLCQYLNQGYRIIINPHLNKKTEKDKKFNEAFHLIIPEFPYSNVYLHYIKRKYFWISDGRKSIKFYDIMQFYQQKGLDNAALLNLNICKKYNNKLGKKCNNNLGKIINKIERTEQEQANKEKREVKHFKEYENGASIRCEKCNTTLKIIRKTYIPNPEKFYDNEDLIETPEMKHYARNDVYVTKKLSEHLYDIFQEMESDQKGLIINNPISQANVAKIAFRKHSKYTENIFTMPIKENDTNKYIREEVRLNFIQYCINRFTGGLFMTLKKGAFKQENNNGVYLADINSAYPAVQCKLKSIMNLSLQFFSLENKNNKIYYCDKELTYNIKKRKIYYRKCPEGVFDGGILKVRIHQTHELFNIFPVHLKNGAVIYPNTKNQKDGFISYISAHDYFLYRKMKNMKIDVINGFFYRYTKSYNEEKKEYVYIKPYSYLTDDYIFRKHLKDAGNPAEHGVKIKINATFGATIQATKKNKLILYNANIVKENPKLKPVRIYDQYFLEVFDHYEAGGMYNILNGGEITNKTQNKIKEPFITFRKDGTAKCFNDNLNYLVQLATDSILTTRKIELNYGNKLGQWKLEKENKSAIIGGNGIITIGNKEVDGEDEINKFRGYQTKTDIKKLLFDNSNQSIIELPTTQLIGYTTKTPEVDFNQINKKHLKKINLNQKDHKRIWEDGGKKITAGDLTTKIYTSQSALLGDYKIPCEYVPLNAAKKPSYKHEVSLLEQLSKQTPAHKLTTASDEYDTHYIDSTLTTAEQRTERRRQTNKTLNEYFEH